MNANRRLGTLALLVAMSWYVWGVTAPKVVVTNGPYPARLHIDRETTLQLDANETREVHLDRGEHTLEATAWDGALHWRTTLVVGTRRQSVPIELTYDVDTAVRAAYDGELVAVVGGDYTNGGDVARSDCLSFVGDVIRRGDRVRLTRPGITRLCGERCVYVLTPEGEARIRLDHIAFQERE